MESDDYRSYVLGTLVPFSPATHTHTAMQTSLTLSGSRPRIVTDRNTIDLDDLAETLKVLKERLLILAPDFEKMEKYPALRSAYDNYKAIEAMLRDAD